MAGAAALATVLVARLAYWQVFEHSRITALAADQHQVTFKIPAHRGRILDRNGQLLATDTPVFNVVAAPDLIPLNARQATADSLSPLVGIDAAELMKQVSQPLKFVYIKRRVDQLTADKIAERKFTGIALEQDSQRSYLTSLDAPSTAVGPVVVIPGVVPTPSPSPKPSPSPSPGVIVPQPLLPHSLASNLLGFVNHDGAGQYGVEQFYDSELRGQDGVESTLKTGANQTITLSDREKVEPRNGVDLQLGLDSQVQFYAEKALAEGVQRTGAESGSVIVMEPATGNIVAWADYPSFDANHFSETDNKYFTDPLVSGLYEPGSVMKLVTMSGGLDSHAVTPDYTFNETGSVNVGGYTIRDWDLKAHGNINMSRVIEQSLNVGAVKVQQLEGADSFYKYLNLFGIGRGTGVDIANEVNQPLPALREMHASELATASFGQGVVVTPVQMITAVNAVANGGRVVQPRAVTTKIDGSGRRTDLEPVLGDQAVSPQVAAQVRDMMINVVDSPRGSGWTARLDGWKGRIAGKTGTANIPENGKYTDKVVASFVGFMPAENPRFTMLVVMRKPQGGGFQQEGTFAAAPVWKQIAQQILVQWQITP
jgi:cell division protein FtsI/penicillin-binding protein 2